MPPTPFRVAVAAAVTWLAFAFRFQAPVFHNDHFEHLSMARQVLFGELPGRDFFDPGRPLTVLLSAGGQALFGHSLFGEALLTIGALALGAGIVFWLASGISRSITAGLLAALLVIVISPRLYSYPKIIVFAVLLLAVWWYAKRPSTHRAALLGALTVFALLMRHDFGVYAGIVCLATVAAGFSRTHMQRTAAYLAACAILAAPYLVWMQQNGLLAPGAASGVASLAGAARVTWPPLRLDLSHGLLHLDPVRARVTVRWSAETTADQRRVLERRYGLVQGQAEDEHTISYGITDDSRENLRALVADAHAEDTGGIDRGSGTLARPAWNGWASRVGISRLVVGPFFDPEGAESWLYYLFWLIAVAGLALAAGRIVRAGLSPELITVAAAAGLGVLLNLFLLRGSLDSRLPDVVVPPAVVGAWLLAESFRRLAKAAVLPRVAGFTAGAGAAIVLGAALFTYGRVEAAGLLRAPVNVAGVSQAARFLALRPIDTMASADSSDIAGLTRYVFDCTTPQDRLLLVAYEPGVFYYAERLFAGGIEHFHQRRFSSPGEQAKILATLARQRVPLVIVEGERVRMLQDDYADVFDHITAHYTPAGETTFGTDRLWRILAARSFAQTGNWQGLPCFA